MIGRDWKQVTSRGSFRSRAQCAEWSLKCLRSNHGEAARRGAELGLGARRVAGGGGVLPPRLRPPSASQVSFQHEVYPAEPASGPVAPSQEPEERPLSRQVFIVQELEVRDRLASSQINKFLYLHTSERMPRRAHSNMVPAAPLGRAWGFGDPGECRGSGGPSRGRSVCRCGHD